MRISTLRRFVLLIWSGWIVLSICGVAAATTIYAMARDGLFFRFAARLQPRFQTPTASVIFLGSVAALLALSGTFEELYSLFVFASVDFLRTDCGGIDSIAQNGIRSVATLSCLGLSVDSAGRHRDGNRADIESLDDSTREVIVGLGHHHCRCPILLPLAWEHQAVFTLPIQLGRTRPRSLSTHLMRGNGTVASAKRRFTRPRWQADRVPKDSVTSVMDLKRGTKAMLYKAVSFALIAVLLQGALSESALGQGQQPQQETVTRIKEVLEGAVANHKAVRVRLKQTVNNQSTLTGTPSEVSDSDFVLTDRKTGAATKLTYADVRDVKRTGMSKAAKVAIGIGIGVVALMVVAVLVTKPWRSE